MRAGRAGVEIMTNCNNCGRFVGKKGRIEVNEEPYFIWMATCEKCIPAMAGQGEIVNNETLVELAILAGFDKDEVGFATASNGENVVIVPRNIEALENLENLAPGLREVESRFHSWLITARSEMAGQPKG